MCAWKSWIDCSAMRGRLPDSRAFIRCDVQRLAGLHAERRIPVVDVPDDTVDAVLAITVGIAGGEVADRFRSHLAGPDLRPAHEHALVAGEAVDDRRLLAM